jgi:hypothetical protein
MEGVKSMATDYNEEMGVMFAITALRNALLGRGVLTQEDIDHAVGEIFAKMALDKTLGARKELLALMDVPTIEKVTRNILHPGWENE